jgi:hypothetical protein
LIDRSGTATEVAAATRGALVRGLTAAAPRREAPDDPALIKKIAAAETKLVEELRRPSEEDLRNRTRFAVTPLLAAIVT